MSDVPNLVTEGIRDAVSSAIQFGVDAKEFKRLVAQAWGEELREKRERDVEELSS